MTLTLEQLYEICAQECHAVIGWALVTGLYLFERPWLWTGILVLNVVVGFKESAVDPRTEPNEPFLWSGCLDWAMYWPGILLALLMLHLAFGFL